MWAEVQDRLNQSLHNAVLLNLGKAEQRHQVSRPWDSQLRIADQASRPLDPETAIVEVFDRKDINGRLLILGNPGAGKTTTMLDLATALVQRANTDPTQPIPVMFNLSSWQDDKQTLKDWLLSELKLKYGVSTKLGQKWLEAQTLLPLLDGLDELPPHRQEPAVQKINDWLQSGEGASQLLVCSRREEYELYATKLLLNGAICLEPLTDEQLATYFAALGMEPLWHTVRQDPDFLALVRTPCCSAYPSWPTTILTPSSGNDSLPPKNGSITCWMPTFNGNCTPPLPAAPTHSTNNPAPNKPATG